MDVFKQMNLCMAAMAMCLCAVFVSCGDDNDEPPIELSVSPASLTMDADGTTTEYFDVKSNTDWVAVPDEGWVTLSETRGNGNGSVRVTVSENTNTSKRTASITVKAGDKTERVRVTQEAASPLNVSPSELNLEGTAGATGMLTITTDRQWSITGKPAWLQLSGEGGAGNTTITLTTLSENRSEQAREATLTITAGTKTAQAKVVQAGIFPQNVYVNVKEEYGLSNGYYFNLSFGSEVQGFTYILYNASYYDSFMSEDAAYDELTKATDDDINQVNSKEDFWTYWYDLTSEKEYILCTVAYKMKGKERQWGRMTSKRVKTKSTSSNFDCTVGTITYTSTRWSYYFTKHQRCHHFYDLYVSNTYAEYLNLYPDIYLAKTIKDLINENDGFDYTLNDGGYYTTRTSSDYAFLVWAWGVSDTGEFSNNISRSYIDTSSSSRAATPRQQSIVPYREGQPKELKVSRAEHQRLLQNVKMIRR